MILFFIQATLYLVLIAGGFLLNAQVKIIQELLSVTFIYAIVLSVLAWRGMLRSIKDSVFSFAYLLIVTIGLITTVQAMSLSVDVALPRLKLILRILYYLYLILLPVLLVKKVPMQTLVVFSLLFSASLPFLSIFVYGVSRGIPFFLTALLFAVIYRNEILLTLKTKYSIQTFIVLSVFVLLMVLANLNGSDLTSTLPALFLSLASIGTVLLMLTLDKKTIFVLLTLFALFHVIYFVFSYISTIQFYIETQAASNRESLSDVLLKKWAFLGGVNTNDIAGYISIAIALPLTWILYHNDAPLGDSRFFSFRFKIIISIFTAMALLLVLFLTQARSAYPVPVLVIILLTFILLRNASSAHVKKKIATASVVLLIASAVLLAVLLTQTSIFTSAKTLFLRRELWNLALYAIVAKPLLGYGWGLGRLYSALTDVLPINADALKETFADGAAIHCHNLFLQMSVDNGVPFTLLFIFVLGYAFYKSFTLYSHDEMWRLIPILGVTGFIFHSFLNYTIMIPFIFLTLILFIFLMLEDGNIQPAEESLSKIDVRVANITFLSSLLIIALGVSLYIFSMYHFEKSYRLFYRSIWVTANGEYILTGIDSDNEKVNLRIDDLLQSQKHISKSLMIFYHNPTYRQWAGELALSIADHIEKNSTLTGDQKVQESVNLYQDSLNDYHLCSLYSVAPALCLKREAFALKQMAYITLKNGDIERGKKYMENANHLFKESKRKDPVHALDEKLRRL